MPLSRILIERHMIPREEMSLDRIREWMRANPESAEQVRRGNSLSAASAKHSFGSIPNAWKLKSKIRSPPSQTVECFSEVIIRHGLSGITSIAKRKVKFTSQ